MSKRVRTRRSWREKLERSQEAKVCDVPPTMAARCGPGRMLIPRPLDVDAVIRRTRAGELVTPGQIRGALARQSGADVTCPLTTGIFIRIAAEAAEDDRRSGREQVTPYWRVVTGDGRLNPKFPGGIAAQAERLAAEGHVLEPAARGGAPRVQGFPERLVDWG